MKLASSLVALSALAFVWGTSGGQAAPFGGPQNLAAAAQSLGNVERAHGCHSHYARGMQGWHRHGADCTLRRDLAEGKRRKKI
jgi:hypothetical protein